MFCTSCGIYACTSHTFGPRVLVARCLCRWGVVMCAIVCVCLFVSFCCAFLVSFVSRLPRELFLFLFTFLAVCFVCVFVVRSSYRLSHAFHVTCFCSLFTFLVLSCRDYPRPVSFHVFLRFILCVWDLVCEAVCRVWVACVYSTPGVSLLSLFSCFSMLYLVCVCVCVRGLVGEAVCGWVWPVCALYTRCVAAATAFVCFAVHVFVILCVLVVRLFCE